MSFSLRAHLHLCRSRLRTRDTVDTEILLSSSGSDVSLMTDMSVCSRSRLTDLVSCISLHPSTYKHAQSVTPYDLQLAKYSIWPKSPAGHYRCYNRLYFAFTRHNRFCQLSSNVLAITNAPLETTGTITSRVPSLTSTITSHVPSLTSIITSRVQSLISTITSHVPTLTITSTPLLAYRYV